VVRQDSTPIRTVQYRAEYILRGIRTHYTDAHIGPDIAGNTPYLNFKEKRSARFPFLLTERVLLIAGIAPSYTALVVIFLCWYSIVLTNLATTINPLSYSTSYLLREQWPFTTLYVV